MGKKYKIVIAEDEETLREIYRAHIDATFDDVDVIEYDNGNDLGEKVLQENPDLFLTDNDMPGGKGKDAIKHLRDNKYGGITILASGLLSEEEAKKVGTNHFFRKPFSCSNLITIIREDKKRITS